MFVAPTGDKRSAVELSPEQVIALFRELERINARLDEMSKPGAICAVHAERLDQFDDRFEKIESGHGARIAVVEAQQTKQNLVAAAFGAIAGAIILALKFLFSAQRG